MVGKIGHLHELRAYQLSLFQSDLWTKSVHDLITFVSTIVLRPTTPFFVTDLSDHRSRVEQQLCNEILTIIERFNCSSSSSLSGHVPSLGSSQLGTEHLIDFTVPAISPYRFCISHSTQSQHQGRYGGVGAAALRLLSLNLN